MRLRHGPIDVLIAAAGDPAEVALALAQARAAFPHILPAICEELPFLRTVLPPSPCGRGWGRGSSARRTIREDLPPEEPLLQPLPQGDGGRTPTGIIARAMHDAVAPYADHLVTPMAAVAGAVADALLQALTANRTLRTAHVNNGGDIAFHLAPGTSLRCGLVAELAAPALDGVFDLHANSPSRGIATSGRACKGQGGRSFSFGIADAVTILARNAAEADAAATVVANAVDLPGHGAITRRPADEIDPLTDLGPRRITWDVGRLTHAEIHTALDAGVRVAHSLVTANLIHAAVLSLHGEMRQCGLSLPALELT